MERFKVFGCFFTSVGHIEFLVVVSFVKECVIEKIRLTEVFKRKFYFKSGFASVWVNQERPDTN